MSWHCEIQLHKSDTRKNMALKVHNDCFPLKSSFRSCKMSILLEIDCKIGGFMSLFELKKCRTIFTYMYNRMFIKKFPDSWFPLPSKQSCSVGEAWADKKQLLHVRSQSIYQLRPSIEIIWLHYCKYFSIWKLTSLDLNFLVLALKKCAQLLTKGITCSLMVLVHFPFKYIS